MDITFGKVISVLGGIAFLITTSFGVNAYFAKDKDLTSFKQETTKDFALLNKSFQSDQINRDEKDIYRQLYDAQDRLKKTGPNQDLNDRIRDLQNQLLDIKNRRDNLKNEIK